MGCTSPGVLVASDAGSAGWAGRTPPPGLAGLAWLGWLGWLELALDVDDGGCVCCGWDGNNAGGRSPGLGRMGVSLGFFVLLCVDPSVRYPSNV